MSKNKIRIYQLSKIADKVIWTDSKTTTVEDWMNKEKYPRNDDDYIWTTICPDTAERLETGGIRYPNSFIILD